MRGKAVGVAVAPVVTGITPACAGKSARFAALAAFSRDHPRVCGEKLQQHGPGWWPWGSPPRVRGKDTRSKSAYNSAGKRSRCTFVQRLRWEHPRVCGEKPFLFYGGSSDSGSPPRMRGKDSDGGQRASASRITPAYAEKRYWQRTIQREYRDHPRICGEKITRPLISLSSGGSPPRMRGKGAWYLCIVLFTGITPAYAGKSQVRSGVASLRWDHPRVCGEKLWVLTIPSCLVGSPPRMRGKAGRVGANVLGTGITPAYAGKSL